MNLKVKSVISEEDSYKYLTYAKFKFNSKIFPGLTWKDNYSILEQSDNPGYIFIKYNMHEIFNDVHINYEEYLKVNYKKESDCLLITAKVNLISRKEDMYPSHVILYSAKKMSSLSIMKEEVHIYKVYSEFEAEGFVKGISNVCEWVKTISVFDFRIHLKDCTMIQNKPPCDNKTVKLETKDSSDKTNFYPAILSNSHNLQILDKDNPIFMQEVSDDSFYKHMEERLQEKYLQNILNELKQELRDVENWKYDGKDLIYERVISKSKSYIFIKAANRLGFSAQIHTRINETILIVYNCSYSK